VAEEGVVVVVQLVGTQEHLVVRVIQQIVLGCDLLELFRLRCIHLWVSIAGVRDWDQAFDDLFETGCGVTRMRECCEPVFLVGLDGWCGIQEGANAGG